MLQIPRVSVSLAILLFTIFVLHIAALYFFWYWSIWWYDLLIHFLGGIFIGGLALTLFKRSTAENGDFLSILFVTVSVVAFFGIVWELFELSVDSIIAFNDQNDRLDTITDLAVDITGGLIAPFFFWKRSNVIAPS